MIPLNYVKEFVEKSVKKNWNEPAFSDYLGKTYSYKDVAIQIQRLHEILKIWEVAPGDKVALIGRNNSNWAIAYLATVSYGAVIVPILADFPPNDVHHIVNHSDSVFLFAGDSIWENLDFSGMPNLRAAISLENYSLLNNRYERCSELHRCFEAGFETTIQNITPESINYPETSNDKLAVISYTSGTTGFSKGVMLQHNSLAANVDFGRNNIALVAKDKIVSFLPLAHAYGCVFEFLMPFSVGCHITFLTKTPSPNVIMQAFQDIKPRLVLAVPLIIEKMYKKRILPTINKPAMKVLLKVPGLNSILHQKINQKLTDAFGGNFLEIVIGGAPLSKEVEDFLRLIKFPFTIGYGMTECGPLISYSGWKTTKPYSCGKYLPTLEVKIDSPDPANVVGEIIMRGENVMVGYYKNEEATNSTLVDGWLRSGDLGIMDNDGFIFIKGRCKSMLLGASGQNIYPEEIEAKINNMPYVQESIVLEKNNRFVALIYPDMEAIDKDKLSENDVQTIMEQNRVEVNKTLPSYCQIAKVKLYPQEFEKTPKRSIKRFLYEIPEE